MQIAGSLEQPSGAASSAAGFSGCAWRRARFIVETDLCETFIELNGASIEADDADLYPQYLALAEGKLTERAFAAWLRERLQSTPRDSVHERPKPYRAKTRSTSGTAARARPGR